SSKEAMGWGFDLGILSQISEFFRLGLMLNDFTDTEIKWAKETGIKGLSEDKIKRDLGIGAYFKPIKYILCVIDYSELLIDRASLHTGVEVFPVEHIVLRGGAFQQSGKYNWTLGLGINWKNWRFDYAFNDHFDLDATNIFSLSYRFVRKGENNP
ncbi:MAG: hypothetical protein JW827_12320, partial [Spirochaetes bacterium]|nr:hypothetical protein [Spirochaetota bacterium]